MYGEAPHEGRGGWTWYTGSAGWLYRAGLEAILGFHLRDQQLTLTPCIPPDWDGFTIRYLHRKGSHPGTPYEITVDRQIPGGVPQLTIDGQVQGPGRNTVDLATDGAPHRVHLAWLATGAGEQASATHSA